jgi:hypothetical protein
MKDMQRMNELEFVPAPAFLSLAIYLLARTGVVTPSNLPTIIFNKRYANWA